MSVAAISVSMPPGHLPIHRQAGFSIPAGIIPIRLLNTRTPRLLYLKAPASFSASRLPTFEDVYNLWIDFKFSLKKKPAAVTYGSYKTAFKHMESLHTMKFKSIRLADLQEVISLYKNKSSGTNVAMMTVLHGMYQYAMKHELVEKDYSKLVTVEWAEPEASTHVPFLESEVERLWAHKDERDVFVVLIMMYTGVRMSEFLMLKTMKSFCRKACFLPQNMLCL